jgi:glyoxylase-like metal-dependent hydrolase (beta-lactamase superfamily II)
MTRPEILAVRYGTRKTRKSEIYFDYARYGEADGEAVMDYYFWVLRDVAETIVIDTGFSAASGAARKRDTMVAPATALKRLGIDPGSVRDVIVTHAHYDHIGNLDMFPNALITMSRSEYEFMSGPFADRPLLAIAMDRDDVQGIVRLNEAGRVNLVGPRHEFRPGIELIELPGHSPGQMSLVIARPGGPVILSSDAVHYYEELEKDRPFAVMSSLLEMYRSLAVIRAMRETPGAVLVPGHDPEVMRRFPPVDPGDPGFAVQIV